MKHKYGKRVATVALTALVVAALAGCSTVGAATGGAAAGGAATSGATAKDSGKKYKIVTVSKVEGISWFQIMSKGVDKFNADNSSEVDAHQTGPSKGDPAMQIAIVEDLIAQKVDAIIVVPNDPIGIAPVLQRARDAGIVVGVTEATKLVGTKAIDFDIEAFDNTTYGNGFAEQLIKAMNCKGKYATSVGLLTSESHMLWVAAANAYIAKKCPTMVNVTPTPVENENDDAKSRALADQLLSTYPDLGGYLATTPSGGSGMASALRDKNRKDVANVANTLPSVAGPDLKDGFLSAGQVWNPAGWGYALNQVALTILKGGKPKTGDDLKWPGYESVKVNGQSIEGNAILSFTPATYADGKYPF